MLESPEIVSYRRRYREVLSRRGPTTGAELLAELTRLGARSYDITGLRRFLDTDEMVVRTGETVSLDPVRSHGPVIEARLVHRLARSAAPMTPDALVRSWRVDDETLGNWVPSAAVLQVLEGLLSRRTVRVFDDGRVGLSRRGVLPDVEPWTDTGLPFGNRAEKFAPGVSQWSSEWGRLVASAGYSVAPANFRSMRIRATDHSGRTAHVTSTTVDLGETVAIVTTAVMSLASAGIGELERRHWWFWAAGCVNPVRDVQARFYGSELIPGEPFRGVHATTSPRGAGEAAILALRAASLGSDFDLTLAFDFGPDMLAGRSAEHWARTPRGPTLAYCLNPTCGLPLSDPESARRGYGRDCWANLSHPDQVNVTTLLLPRGPNAVASHWAYPLTVDEWLALNPPCVSGDPLV